MMSYFKKILGIIFLFIGFITNAQAQIAFSDSIEISLLTCSMGADSYERFGHTGVRIHDLKTHQDIVFHWGVYDFNAPNFIIKFIKGITDYQIGATYTEDFVAQYNRRGIGMIEQKLNISKAQSQQALNAILTNYRPENRHYRYSFLFDNCATRPFDIINSATSNSIVYDTSWVEQITLRDMLQEKTFKNNWLDFGISLAVANRSDKIASFKEQMFLPDYLSKAYDNATIDGHKLIKEEPIKLLETKPEIVKRINNQPVLLSPASVFCILLAVALFIVFYAFGRASKKAEKSAKTLWTLILFGTGVAGCIIWFLNFFSLHPSVDHNVNCLWLLPTNIVFAALIWVKSAEKVNRVYFFIIFALIIAYVIINTGFVHQYFDPAFAPLLATIIVMCCHQNKWLFSRKTE